MSQMSMSPSPGFQGPEFLVDSNTLRLAIGILSDRVSVFRDVEWPEGCNPIDLSTSVLELNTKLERNLASNYVLSLEEYRSIRPALVQFEAITGLESGQAIVDRIVTQIDTIVAGLTEKGKKEPKIHQIN